MRDLWSQPDAEGLNDIALLRYMSRLVGLDSSLVVWGGGNTSLKTNERDFRGRPVAVLRVKGSGSDLKSVGEADFTGVRMDDVLPLEDLADMSDEEMVEYLAHTIMDQGSPRPSIETLLHAFLPGRCVLHSHADAVVALSNTQAGSSVLQDALGPSAALVAYRRPGFLLSKEVAAAARQTPAVSSVVLMNHGLVTWGDSVRAAYESHVAIVTQAEEYARSRARGRRRFGPAARTSLSPGRRRAMAAAAAPVLRGLLGKQQRVLLRYDDAEDVLDFVNSGAAARLSQIGPATPDHLLNTKRLPLFVPADDPSDLDRLGQAFSNALQGYQARYHDYVTRHNTTGAPALAPDPRVVLVPGLGMWTAGRDARAAFISGDIYHHTIAVMAAAEAVDGYTSLSERDAFDAEYWPLELYKLTLQPPERLLARNVALVTGAASGIGRAIAGRFVAEGAHVALADVDVVGAQSAADDLRARHGADRAIAVSLDVTDESSVRKAFDEVSLTWGGIDILVSNAGIAPSSPLTATSLQEWQRSLDVNATGHFIVTRQTIQLLRAQATGGSLVYIASKNVTAPGAGFGAYSAAKAAEAQLARIAAIEGGEHGIRANIVNPDAVFEGSRLFDGQLRAERASAHGVAADDLEEFYRQRNLLHTRIFGDDVAEAALFFASARSAKTTGAMLPVDGGVRDAFPR
jgi:rhamnulose-1-phosphate aldolase/alcohol dehydrogenase